MIVWQGWGILAALIPAALFVLSAVLFGIGGKGTPLEHPMVGIVFTAVLSAIAVWWLGNKLNSAPGRELVDPQTGQRVVLRTRHTLFWIPMQWWAIPILLLGGVALAGMFLGSGR